MNDIINEIKSTASKYNNIEKIVLFGSRARGDNNLKSDIDLAIFGTGDFCEFICDLEDDVHTLLEFDITIMNENLDELFLKQVESEGIIIYEQP